MTAGVGQKSIDTDPDNERLCQCADALARAFSAPKKKSGRLWQLDGKPNHEMRQYAAAPYSAGVSTHDGSPLGGLNRTIVGCFDVE